MLFRFSSSYFSSIYYGLVSPPYYHCYMCHTQTWAHYIDQLVTLYLMRTITMLNCFKLLLHGIIERFEFFYENLRKWNRFFCSFHTHIYIENHLFFTFKMWHMLVWMCHQHCHLSESKSEQYHNTTIKHFIMPVSVGFWKIEFGADLIMKFMRIFFYKQTIAHGC